MGDGVPCDPDPCVCDNPCVEPGDCEIPDLCTCAECIDECCSYYPIPTRPYADVYPVACGDGAVEIMDTLCVLDGASGVGECQTMVGGCMIGDISPCPPPEGTGCDGAIEIMDTLSVLDAASGNPGCDLWCPSTGGPRLGGYSNFPYPSCSQSPGTLTADVGGMPCEDPDEFAISVKGNTIDVLHANATYNCCPDDIEVVLSVEGDVLLLTETEILEEGGCYCICCYDVGSMIVDLDPGVYTLMYYWWDYETDREECYPQAVVIP